jgi:hypothetical protein
MLDARCTSSTPYQPKSYSGGDRVLNAGALYECKPFPYSGWCGLGGAYEPGVGTHWSDAWVLIGRCDQGGVDAGSSDAASQGTIDAGKGTIDAGATNACTPVSTGKPAPPASSGIFIESLTGAVTTNEVDSFKAYISSLTPAADNIGNSCTTPERTANDRDGNPL